MKDNTVKSEVGIEVYQNDILRLVDEYIDTELDGDSESVGDNFVSIIYLVSMFVYVLNIKYYQPWKYLVF